MTRKDKKKTKEWFLEMVGKFNAIPDCCECHPHGEWDDCDYSPNSKSPCKRTCSGMKLRKILLQLMWQYMVVWQFVPVTKAARKKKRG